MTNNFIHIRDLLVELTKKEVRLRYKNSYLGYLWSLLNPIALSIVFFFAFKVIMRVDIDNYALFLVAGLFPWQVFANSVTSSATVFIGNSSLIKKTVFPREALIYSLILSEFFHFFFSIPAIVLLLFIYGKGPSIAWIIGLPVLFIAQFLIISGFSLVIASCNLFFRDLERLVGLFINLLFFMTPIIYSPGAVPEKYRLVTMLNPMTPVISAYREMFIEGVLDRGYLFMSLGWGLVIFFIGYILFGRLKWKLAEVL